VFIPITRIQQWLFSDGVCSGTAFVRIGDWLLAFCDFCKLSLYVFPWKRSSELSLGNYRREISADSICHARTQLRVQSVRKYIQTHEQKKEKESEKTLQITYLQISWTHRRKDYGSPSRRSCRIGALSECSDWSGICSRTSATVATESRIRGKHLWNRNRKKKRQLGIICRKIYSYVCLLRGYGRNIAASLRFTSGKKKEKCKIH